MKFSEEEKLQALKVGFTVPFWKLAMACNKHKEELYHGTSVNEGYNDGKVVILGLSGAILILAIVISFVIFIWALIVLIKYGKDMPQWALVVGIIFFFLPPGPIVTLILVYATKGKKSSGFF